MKRKIVVLALLVLVGACATTEINRLELTGAGLTEQDKALGERTSKLMQAQYPMIYDEQLKGYIVDIRSSLMGRTSLIPSGGDTLVVNDSRVFAYSLPNGDIFISLGILWLAENDSEVAAILAHELAHVHLRHAVRSRQESEALAKRLANFARHNGAFQDQLYISMMAVASYGRSRESEIEADRMMVEFMRRAGLPLDSAWRILQRFSELDISNEPSVDKKGLFDTHPNIQERVRLVRREVKGIRDAEVQAYESKRVRARVQHLISALEE